MRIASMVPSWTETLIAAGADDVARTRFCLHPIEASQIPAVGGTKNVDWQKLAQTSADFLIFDKEENPLSMAESAPLPYWASHVTSVHDMPGALRALASCFASDLLVAASLEAFAVRWETVLMTLRTRRLSGVPAVIEWWRKPSVAPVTTLYLIWKNPYMVAGRNTFIGSMLDVLGVELQTFATKYPEIDLSNCDPATTQLLFSSEPYPFARDKAELSALPFASALVDGESLSWFGIRSLRFLESLV